jgi:methionyl-tRNA formyltransferase
VAERVSTIVFMGSPEFAVATLDALRRAPGHEVVRVVTQPDRPKGRGQRLAPTPVKAYAIEHRLPVETMTKADYAEVVAGLRALGPDFVVVASFGIILKKDLLDLPRHGCVNLHASLLPKYRGVSPIQASILAGDAETGCTTMLMDEGVDTGAMLLSERVAIDPADTAATLDRKLAAAGGPLVVKTLAGILDGSVKPVPQDNAKASYTKKVRKEHGAIDWAKSAAAIERQVRAMLPWPSAYTGFSGKRLIVLEAAVSVSSAGATGAPGTVLSDRPFVVAAGEGALEIKRVKVEGRAEVTARAFLSGYRLRPGDRLD